MNLDVCFTWYRQYLSNKRVSEVYMVIIKMLFVAQFGFLLGETLGWEGAKVGLGKRRENEILK